MTSFDFLILLVLGLSTGLSIMRGGLKEVGTLLVLAVAVGFAIIVSKPLAGAFGAGKSFLAVAALASALGLVSFCALYLLFHKGLQRVPLKGERRKADRIGGGVFGFVRGLALLGLGFLAYGYYLDPADHPRAVKGALFLPVARASADFFEGFAPEENRLDQLRPKKPQEDAAVRGYDRGDRTALSEIVTTVTTTDGSAEGDPIAAVLEQTEPQWR